MKPRILHLSADYPDIFNHSKTSAIKGLVEGTHDSFEHLVVSLNRFGGITSLTAPGDVLEFSHNAHVLACRYRAPPPTVIIAAATKNLAHTLKVELQRREFVPDLIHGHKLTIEGFLAEYLSSLLDAPYVLTLQGNTDQKLINRRPDRLPAVRRIWRGAKGILAFAPWTADWCEGKLGHHIPPPTIIPCIITNDTILPPKATPPVVATAFNLNFWKNKNIETLLSAIKLLSRDIPNISLEIAGDGSEHSIVSIKKIITKYNISDRVRLIGKLTPESIKTWMNNSSVFALPSHRETFGMVFVEALLSGTPVIFSRGTAIDGYLADSPFSVGVKSNSVACLARQISYFIKNNSSIKYKLRLSQENGTLNLFRRSDILLAFERFTEESLR